MSNTPERKRYGKSSPIKNTKNAMIKKELILLCLRTKFLLSIWLKVKQCHYHTISESYPLPLTKTTGHCENSFYLFISAMKLIQRKTKGETSIPRKP